MVILKKCCIALHALENAKAWNSWRPNATIIAQTSQAYVLGANTSCMQKLKLNELVLSCEKYMREHGFFLTSPLRPAFNAPMLSQLREQHKSVELWIIPQSRLSTTMADITPKTSKEQQASRHIQVHLHFCKTENKHHRFWKSFYTQYLRFARSASERVSTMLALSEDFFHRSTAIMWEHPAAFFSLRNFW